MKLRWLVDESTGRAVVEWLRHRGFDVVSVRDSMPQAGDAEIIARARTEDRVIITNDKDFGERIFRDRQGHKGVLLLRLRDERTEIKIDVIRRVLDAWADRLPLNFTVATESRIRIRKT